MAVQIPRTTGLVDLGGPDYSQSLYAAAKGIGDTIAANRNERTRSLEFSAQEERLKQQGLYDYAAAMARINADTDPFGTGGGLIPGNSEKINYANTLNNVDPSDPRWATALYGVYGTPEYRLETINGVKTPVYTYAAVPPHIAAMAAAAGIPLPGGNSPANPGAVPGTVPAAGPASPAAPAPPATTSSTVIQPSGTVTGAPTTVLGAGIPGSEEKPTADESKNRQLYTTMQAELPTLEQKWAALDYGPGALATEMGVSPFWQQMGNALPGVADITTPDYQEASNSLNTIISMFIYSASGATATEGEVARLSALLRPIPGEGAAAKAAKLDRVKQLVASVGTRGTFGWMADEVAREAAVKSGHGLDSGGGGGDVLDAGGGVTFRRK